MKRGFVDGPDGQIFYREAGEGPTVVLVHQILRSSLDYSFVIPLLAKRYRVIAFDNMGCGDSDLPPQPYSLEQHAAALLAAIVSLDVGPAVLAGHHSGANISLEMAVQRPDLCRALVMSGLFYVGDAGQLKELYDKALRLGDPEPQADGSHLLALWNEGLQTNWGKPRLPKDRIDLLTDFFLEQVKGGSRRFEPYVAQMRYDTAARLPRLSAPCLFIKASGDVFMCSASQLWLKDQPSASFREIDVPNGGEMPRLFPEAWSEAIEGFLAQVPGMDGV